MKSIGRIVVVLSSCALASFLAPHAAFAQGAPAATPPAAAAPPKAAPAAPAAPAPPAAGVEVAPAPAVPPPPPPSGFPPPGSPPEDTGMRFRWGITPMGGPMFGGLSGGAGGLDLRFGWQITNMIGAYVQPVAIVGAGSSGAGAANASASVFAAYGAGALIDFTFINYLYVAGGAEILAGGLASASGSTSSAVSGTFFSFPIRAGVVLGSKEPDRRKGFTVGLDMRTIFTPGSAAIIPMIALGYESF